HADKSVWPQLVLEKLERCLERPCPDLRIQIVENEANQVHRLQRIEGGGVRSALRLGGGVFLADFPTAHEPKRSQFLLDAVLKQSHIPRIQLLDQLAVPVVHHDVHHNLLDRTPYRETRIRRSTWLRLSGGAQHKC